MCLDCILYVPFAHLSVTSACELIILLRKQAQPDQAGAHTILQTRIIYGVQQALIKHLWFAQHCARHWGGEGRIVIFYIWDCHNYLLYFICGFILNTKNQYMMLRIFQDM
jgi:surface polysaccharide O-acyltransferase-like enzyme